MQGGITPLFKRREVRKAVLQMPEMLSICR